MFCWIAAALLGGALRIRPHGWIVGPSGAGKTTLQNFLQELMGDWGVFTEDATEAGVRQLLDQDTLAVMFDEIEAEEDNRDR
jgi:ABC-type lipoprotein export system ATPase subunit